MNEELEFTSGQSGAESMLSAIQDRERQYTEEELYNDLDWIEASGKIYQMNNNGEKFQGDHKALAKYGIDQMSEFNYNMSMGMIPDVMAVEGADNETQIAFAYMMDTYDKKDVTLNGVGRAFKELALDPLSYVGISTFGAGFAAKQGAEQIAKAGLKNRLHASIRNYLSSGLAVGATEGALYTAGDTTARQSVYQDAGLMEGYDPASIATSAGLGAVAGAGIVKGAEVVGRQIGKGIDYISQSAQEEMARMAGGGTPTTRKPIIKDGTEIGYIKTSDYGDIINIDDIEMFKRGTGLGTEEIKNVMRHADENGKTVTLTSDAMRGKEGQKKNRALYEKLGFIKNSGANKRKDITEEYYYQGAGGGTPPSEYRGYHKAPTISGANTGDNLADIFPDDIYSNKAVQYYGTGDKQMDTKSIQIIQSMRNNPDKEVTIYRAVPKGVKDINDGDWITINPDYAKWHGESWVENGEYDIISKKVKASQISTNGDSIHEWGYNEGATK